MNIYFYKFKCKNGKIIIVQANDYYYHASKAGCQMSRYFIKNFRKYYEGNGKVNFDEVKKLGIEFIKPSKGFGYIHVFPPMITGTLSDLPKLSESH